MTLTPITLTSAKASRPGEWPGAAAGPAGPRERHGFTPLFVMLGVLAGLLLVDPWRAGAFDDDWTYAAITRHLAATGSFALNGWSSAMLWLQAWVGAGFVRTLGPSADVLRVETLSWHLVGVLAAYRLAARAGARPSLAAFVAAAIGLSPLAVPLSLSFMTDVPATATGLICVAVSVSAWDRASRGDRPRRWPGSSCPGSSSRAVVDSRVCCGS